MSASMQSRYLRCAGREIHFMDWGDADAPVVVAWHGLARTGRDMDDLAAWLVQAGYRVICPDTIGRGLSQWSPLPAQEYQLSFYAQIAQSLLDQLQIDHLDWVGTSMGGAIGTVCAAGLLKGRIRSLVLNDNAPELAPAALERIRAYAGQPPAFETVTELEAFFKTVYEPYGWLSDTQWLRLTETSVRRLPDGRITPHYDPAMVQQFTAHPNDYLIWQHYDAIDIPVLCLRGERSDLVSRAVVASMHTRGPGRLGLLRVEEIAGCGHAPALNVPAQCVMVTEFLQSHSTAVLND
ncbi:alpha/beta hydrolase [Variovorax sp. PCZ-1]|uniref:alpha/beta fold hydrolase n=1 Tax=Variovorax sp. PCZ-1 TaxID=2835533 RepID=UPI001BCC16B4|nr:alpha/beta hydrolase [Variovorax sp. PCZ-1]MBS7808184.1 alpha/beta hydrolase [Variovorax sp. PCZ-1]